MMNKFFMCAVAVLLLASPVAHAGPSVTSEYKMIDNANGTDANEYKLEYNDTLSIVNFGGEITAKQTEHQGGVGSKMALKVGPALPEVLGFKPAVYVEAGRSLASGDDYNFYGAGAKVSHVIYGPISGNVGYRYRKAVNADDLVENRVNAGLSAKIADELSIGSNFYYTRGTSESEAVGVSLIRNF